MATELATGYLSLVAETKGVKKAIEAAFGDSEKAATAAGEKAGKAFTDAAHKKSKAAGRATGRSFGDAMDTGLRQSMPGARWLDDFARQARASGNPVGFTVGRALGGAVKAGLTVGIAGAATVVASTIGAAGYALNKGFDRLKALDSARFKLRALGKTEKEIADITETVLEVVKGTSFSLQDAFAASVAAIGAGRDSSEELTKYLTAIADAAGFANAEFSDMALIFMQVMNKGKLQAEEMLQLNERQVPIQQWLQKELRATGTEIDKMSKDGVMNIDTLIAAVEAGAPGMAKKLGETIEGSMSHLRSAASRVGEEMIVALSGGDLSNVPKSIQRITEQLDALGAWIKDNQGDVVGFMSTFAQVSIVSAMAVVSAFEWTTRAMGWTINALGDVLGGITKGVAWVNELLGRHDIARELHRQAESYFSWGDALLSAADGAGNAFDQLNKLTFAVENWELDTKSAIKFTKQLGKAVAEIVDKDVVLRGPSKEDLDRLDKAKWHIQEIPDTKDVIIRPKTMEAVEEINSFRKQQGEEPVTFFADANMEPAENKLEAMRRLQEETPVNIPVDPQLTAANQKMEAFFEQWSNAIIRPQVAPGSHAPGSDPLSAMTGSAGVATSGVGYPAMTAPGTGSPSISEVDAIAKQFGLTKTSGQRPGDPGYHGQGLAGDYAGSVENMQQFAAYMAKNYGGHLNELIFDAPGWGANVKNGKIVGPFGNVYTLQQAGRHDDHVHIAVRGRASGGAVFGPGTGTSDSIPAWLSNGEHVIPADEVKKAGGQGAIYHLRALLRAGELPGFNRGGAVDQRKVREAQDRIADYQQRVAIAQQELQELEPDAKPSQRLRAQQELSKYQRLFKQAQDDYWVVAQGGTPMSRTAENRVFDADAAVELAQTQLDELLAGGDAPESRLMEARFGVDQAKREAAQAREDLAAAMEQRRQQQLEQQQQTAARTEGYIPAAAGSTAVAGKSAVSGFINMGADVINSLIDQAASAASTAAAAGITAGSMGAGAPGGAQAGAAAAQFAIGLGANAAKRGVSYGFQMAGIGVDTLLEHLTPFGAPRWLTHDYSGFMPRFDLSPEATTTLEEMQSAVDPNTTVHGQAQGAPPGPVVDPMESFTSMMTSLPEPVEPPPQPPMFHVDNIHAADAEDVGRQLTKQGKLWMMQYGSRP